MTRRLLTSTIAAALLAVGLAVPASAGDASGPRCVELIDGELFYNASGVANADLFTEIADCVKGTYTLIVYAQDRETVLARASVAGDGQTTLDGTGFVHIEVAVPTAPASICVQVTSSWSGRVRDSGPDGVPCEDLSKGGTPGGTRPW